MILTAKTILLNKHKNTQINLNPHNRSHKCISSISNTIILDETAHSLCDLKQILVYELEQHYYHLPLPLRGPVNSTCVEAKEGGLREAPALRPPPRFLVYVLRFAFLPNYLMS